MPPLPGLAVDADHRVVGAADVRRIDRQVGHVPQRLPRADSVAPLGKALLDRVLVRAGKRGEHEVAAVRMARMHRNLVAVFDRADDLVDVGKVDARVDTLREEVEPERHEADVARALAVAEEAALDPLRAGHQRELGGSNAAAAVVVRVYRQHDRIAARERRRHPFDLVGVEFGVAISTVAGRLTITLRAGVGCQIVVHRVADLDREVELGAGEALGRVLEHPIRTRARRRAFADQLGAVDRDVDGCPRGPVPNTTRRCVVDVEL